MAVEVDTGRDSAAALSAKEGAILESTMLVTPGETFTVHVGRCDDDESGSIACVSEHSDAGTIIAGDDYVIIEYAP